MLLPLLLKIEQNGMPFRTAKISYQAKVYFLLRTLMREYILVSRFQSGLIMIRYGGVTLGYFLGPLLLVSQAYTCHYDHSIHKHVHAV